MLFCDLVGSTSLAESLDPEDLREVTAAYHSACETIIRRHDGHIAQYLGDGVMVYFGFPVAHEDDARRAVRTGLEITGALAALTGRLQEQHGIALNARLGIHTGAVVGGRGGEGATSGGWQDPESGGAHSEHRGAGHRRGEQRYVPDRPGVLRLHPARCARNQGAHGGRHPASRLCERAVRRAESRSPAVLV